MRIAPHVAHHTLRRRTVVLVALCLALLLSGCGGDRSPASGRPSDGVARLSKADYVSAVRAAFAEASLAGERAGEGPDAQLDAVETLLNRLVRRLSALRPPAEVARAHADYTGGLRAVRDVLVPRLDAARRGDERAVGDLGAAVPPAVRTRIANARRTFARLGYDLGTDPVAG